MPREGMNRREYRERKFGGAQVVEEMDRRLAVVGAEEGIRFALDRIEKTPNTFDAHRLAWWADRMEAQEAVVEGLFRAFFTEGRDIGDRAVLADVARQAGLDGVEAARFLESDEGSREVRSQEEEARRRGVEAVPFFVIGGRYAVSGAQEPEVFLQAFEELTRRASAGS
jgi:predicted DsbA family dithiol-disulfide isomerase